MTAARWRLAAGGLLGAGPAGPLLPWRGLVRAGSRLPVRPTRLSAGVVLVTVVTYVPRAWRWGYLLAPLARVPFARLFSATTVGFMTGLFVPRAGEVVRPYLVGRRMPSRSRPAFASIILERLVDLFTVLLLFARTSTCCRMPAAQTRGPLLGRLKVGRRLARPAAAVVAPRRAARVPAAHGRARHGARRATAGPLPARPPAPSAAPPLLRPWPGGAAGARRAPLAIFGQSLLLWLSIGLACTSTTAPSASTCRSTARS